jgi:hypothetical protein
VGGVKTSGNFSNYASHVLWTVMYKYPYSAINIDSDFLHAFRQQRDFRESHMALLRHPPNKAIILFLSWHWIVIGISQDGAPNTFYQIRTYQLMPLLTNLLSHWTIPLTIFFAKMTTEYWALAVIEKWILRI